MRFTGAVDEAPVLTIASAATTDIGAARANTLILTGSASITSFGVSPAGTTRLLIFDGIIGLVHSSALIAPTGATYFAAPGDTATFVSLGGGNWRCVSYMRAVGWPIAAGYGNGQSWVDVTASRALSTTYTNSSSRVITVSVWSTGTGAYASLVGYIGGVLIASGSQAPAAGGVTALQFNVPGGSTYSVVQGGSAPIAKWWEFK